MSDTPLIPFECTALTVSEACAALRLSRGTLYKIIREGRLRPLKFGAATRIPGREILRLQSEAPEPLDPPRPRPRKTRARRG